MHLTDIQLDRAAGLLLGQACGDALGVPYELGSLPLPMLGQAQMLGGGLGNYSPGEFSDDTQMAVAILRGVRDTDGWTPESVDAIAERFLEWRRLGASDIGNQTRVVLTGAAARGASAMTEVARALHDSGAQTAGNGALMRTAVVALTALGDPEEVARRARIVCDLTHFDQLAEDSCVIWSIACHDAVLTGSFTWEAALGQVDQERRSYWGGLLEQAETVGSPEAFRRNGFTVTALQAAVWALAHGSGERGDWLESVLQLAISVSNDTDTVAAIAGALAGAVVGSAAVPAAWRAVVHGWPGLDAGGLSDLARQTATA